MIRLVTTDQESNITRLVHYTTQEYFERNPLLNRDDTQKKISSACIAYLSQDAFSQGPCENNAALDFRLKQYPFVAYAALNWGKHTRGPPEKSCSDKIVRFLRNANLGASALQISTSTRNIHDKQQGRPSWSQNYHKDVPMLALAAGSGLAEIVKQLLDEGQDHQVSDSSGATALHWAAAAGEMKTIQILLAAGADVHKVNIRGESPLVEAAEQGHLEVIVALIQHGADVTTEGTNALQDALIFRHDSIARFLLEKGAIPHQHLISLAIHDPNGDPILAKLLIEKSIERFEKESHGLLRLLEQNLSVSTMEMLIKKGFDVNCAGADGTAPLHVAARHGSLENVKFLLSHLVDPNRMTDNGYTPLHWAAFCGHTEVVQLLLGHGAEAAAQDRAGETALHTCLHHTPNEDILLFLSSKRYLLDIIDNRGRTALHEAACRGFTAAVKILIDRGATVNLPDNEHWTPLQLAAAGGHEETINHLLGNDRIPEKATYEHLLRAANFRNAVATNEQARSNLLLKDPHLDISLPDQEGRTALHHAAYNGDMDMVRILLERGAYVNAKIVDTAYRYLVDYGPCTIQDLNLYKWVTPLHDAAGRGHFEIVAILLDYAFWTMVLIYKW